MRIRRLGILCASFFLVLTACDGSGSNEEGNEAVGEARLSITGEGIDESFDGSAFFIAGTEPRTGERVFIVYLFEGEQYTQSASFAFLGRNAERPEAGQYAVADADDKDEPARGDQFTLFATVGSSNSQPGTTYLSASGSLELETSTEERVAGTLDVQGTGITTENGQQTVHITGSFEAPQRSNLAAVTFN